MQGMLINESGDLQVSLGAVVIGECSMDVARRVLETYPGEFKEVPEIGCNARQIIAGKASPFWRGEAVKQLASQHIKADIIVTEEELQIKIK